MRFIITVIRFQSTLRARRSDSDTANTDLPILSFQSTLRARRSDRNTQFFADTSLRYFNPRSARGGATVSVKISPVSVEFQSTLRARRSDMALGVGEGFTDISIHAPREAERHFFTKNILQFFI